MLFTAEQSKTFIDQLKHKKTIQTALTSCINDLSEYLHTPVTMVNSGSKRIWEKLLNDNTEDNKQSHQTTQSINISLSNTNVDGKDNTSPSETQIFLQYKRIPHKFITIGSQKRLIFSIDAKFMASNALEALEHTEFIIDNLTGQRPFKFMNLGIQYSGSYSLSTESFDKSIDKTFSYDNSTNGVDVSFTIDVEIAYISIKTASLISYILAHTENTLIGENEDGDIIIKNPNDYDDGDNDPTDDGAMLLDDYEINKYIGTVTAMPNPQDSITYTSSAN